MTEQLSPQVIAADRRLDDNAKRASEDLAKHRWHWTLDESNPDRVSIRAYARAVGRHHRTISVQANGFSAWVAQPAAPPSEHIERAGIGIDDRTFRRWPGVEYPSDLERRGAGTAGPRKIASALAILTLADQ